MRIPRPALLSIVLALAFVAASSPAAPAAERTPMSFTARTGGPLTADAMTPEETIWYNRIVAAMDASSVLANDMMTGGDAYMVGRGGGDYVEALLMAFRATGDLRFLDRVYELTELARGSLKEAWLDGTHDGFTSWLWLIDPTNATYYGKDINWLDESICSGNVALWTWAFQANRNLDPRYAAAADFWRGWLENQFLAKWYQRAGGDPLVAWNTPYAAFYKPDVEPRSANWRLAHYLWKVTGNTFYRDRENQIVAEFSPANHINPAHPNAYRWTKETSPTSVNWQPVNYANYYMRAVLEMNLEGMPFFSSPVEMKRFAATFREVVYANSLPSLTTMTNTVNGDGSIAYAPYAFNGFATWDSSGFLLNLANLSIVGAGNYSSGGLSKAARNDVFLSGYALMAMSPMGPTPALVANFQAIPLDDGTVQIQWQLSGTDGGELVNLYRVSADGIERTLVNDAPIEGPGQHSVIDTAPLDAPTLTYQLVELTATGERTLGRIVVDRGHASGVHLRLEQNSPNPFGGSTLIQFEVPRAEHVRVAIHDSAGRLVRTLESGDLPAGHYARQWDGRDSHGTQSPSGIYFFVAETPTDRVVRRAILVK